MGNDSHQGIQTLRVAAYAVIVAYGIHIASHLIGILLISLLLTYAILPFPQWLVRRFNFPKSAALGCTVLFVIAIYSVLTFALVRAGLQVSAKLPVYELRIQDLHQQFTDFLAQFRMKSIEDSVNAFLSSNRIEQFIRDIAPAAIGFFSDRLLIWFLTLLFLVELLDPQRGHSPIANRLAHFGKDIQVYIATTAETGAVAAVVNLVLLTVLRVDFAVVWCVLYFFLHFIPSIGFMLALVPPTLLALLMLGWKRAVLVFVCLVLTEMLGENVLKPMLLKKELDVSLLVVTLSLVGWGYLIGPAGAILSVPLTLGLQRMINEARMGASSQKSAAATALGHGGGV